MPTTLTADNHYGLFTGPADGLSLSFIGRNDAGVSGNPGTWSWSLPETWTFTPAAGEHIYVVAWNDGGPESWIGQFALPDGTTRVSNARDWEAVVNAGPNPGSSGPVPAAWREDYDRVHPHASLGHRTPFEFARRVDGHAHLPALHG